MRATWCKARSCWFNCCSGMKSGTMLRHPIPTPTPALCSTRASAVRCSACCGVAGLASWADRGAVRGDEGEARGASNGIGNTWPIDCTNPRGLTRPMRALALNLLLALAPPLAHAANDADTVGTTLTPGMEREELAQRFTGRNAVVIASVTTHIEPMCNPDSLPPKGFAHSGTQLPRRSRENVAHPHSQDRC